MEPGNIFQFSLTMDLRISRDPEFSQICHVRKINLLMMLENLIELKSITNGFYLQKFNHKAPPGINLLESSLASKDHATVITL